MLKYNFNPAYIHCKLQGKGIPVKTNRNIYKMLLSKSTQAQENAVTLLIKLNVLIEKDNIIMLNENEKTWTLEKHKDYTPPFLPIYDHKNKKFVRSYIID